MKYLILFICLLTTHSVFASDFMPAKTDSIQTSAQNTTLYLGMDKSELLHLDQNAASVVVGNPEHASVLMDNPRLLVIIPKAPGATFFSVLDPNGQIIAQRHVIVGAPQNNYIRVRKAQCGANDKNCGTPETFYCPDMCHEIINPQSSDAAKTSDISPRMGNNYINPANVSDEEYLSTDE